MAPDFGFTLLATDGAARLGEIATAHGLVRTPAFMPIGTQGTVKGAHTSTGARPVPTSSSATRNHLMLRPGAERIAALSGLHTFMNWPHPILTDSDGFQVMSLSELAACSSACLLRSIARVRRVRAGTARRDDPCWRRVPESRVSP